MRVQAGVVLFVASLILASGFVLVVQNIWNEQSQGVDVTAPGVIATDQHSGEIDITQVLAWKLASNRAEYLNIEVTGGNTPVLLTDTLITIQVEQNASDLTVGPKGG